MTRQLRGLLPVEALALVGIALIPWPEQLPLALPLVVVATLSRYVRGRSWADVAHAPAGAASLGALAGAAALAIAVVAGTPLLEGVAGRAIEWSEHPIVRGSGARLAVVALQVAVAALAYELALRGWVVERLLELVPDRAAAAIAGGALAEALVTPGDLAARAGAFVFGAGLGGMYVAAGRNVVVSVSARATFAAGVVLLEAVHAIG
ncbi:MAG: hypothetical protein KF773_23275 [Deltaproteobacteria bacterium]|nr:hypothetical protein [Deltaproteobacteria bacterium]